MTDAHYDELDDPFTRALGSAMDACEATHHLYDQMSPAGAGSMAP